MNAPDSFLTLNLGEAEVRVPREAAVLAYLEHLVDQRRTLDLSNIPGARIAFQRDCAHEVGEQTKDGLYAGLSIHDNRAVELYLLPRESDELAWKDAIKWAEEQGGQLPSRMDQLVLLKNMKAEFKEECYWSGEQHADERWAWYQDFDYGTSTTTARTASSEPARSAE
jgi:hypothetical protein